jgi:D-alanyl-D-alanine carboxypeptidase
MFIYSTKNNSATLRKEAREALIKLSIEFWANFEWNKIKVISWYRSFEEQKRIEESKACEDNLCAKAGHSEHQTGLAVDLFLVDWDLAKEPEIKQYFDWMQKNAHHFWFTNTYIKWQEIDWYKKEPWHWRYVWVELATYLKENNMSFAEFYMESKK